jgi:hypothetical protein
MATRRPRLAAAALALAALLLAPGAAAAAPPAGTPAPAAPSTPAPGPASALLPELARQLQVSPQRLESAVRAAVLERWRAYAHDHAVPPERAAAVERRIARAPVTLHAHFGSRLRGGLLGAAADYLGLDRASLQAELRQGRSLAEIAAQRGRPAEGLKEALQAAARRELDRRVADGELTPAARDRMLADLPAHIQALIERRPPAAPGRTQPLRGLSRRPPRTAP